MDSQSWFVYCTGCMAKTNLYMRIHVWIIDFHNRFVDFPISVMLSNIRIYFYTSINQSNASSIMDIHCASNES